MKKIQIAYTILDTIEVPDDWTEEEIGAAVFDNAFDHGICGMIDDTEWEVVE